MADEFSRTIHHLSWKWSTSIYVAAVRVSPDPMCGERGGTLRLCALHPAAFWQGHACSPGLPQPLTARLLARLEDAQASRLRFLQEVSEPPWEPLPARSGSVSSQVSQGHFCLWPLPIFP